MEKLHFDNPQDDRQEQLKKKFEYYLKDFPLTDEDLQKPLLDVGTGKGEFIEYIREVLGNTQAIGVERQGSKIVGKEGLIEADGLNLPFENESFEVVTAHNYLPMFVGDPNEMQTAILELLRVVKKEGKMMGDIHTPKSVQESNDQIKTNLGEEYSDQDEVRFKEDYKGAEDLQRFLEKLKEKHDVQLINPTLSKTVLIIKK